MYLKSLVLKGFKSFADRSVLSLEPGITAIVGPNGSGKSNISDAVLWVLGERNAKNLRGQVMEDVIFAGSSARKSVSTAEVTLVLDNSDGSLPVDYREVAVTRRMYRNGESDYLINNTLARRMDVLDILHDSGLGTGTHSIISQGHLDGILSSRPEDRRALIEEAAGVLKHKQRKAKSQRKLEQMDHHLERVNDVVKEVERQLGPLQRKARRAMQYAEASTQLKDIQLVLAVDDLRVLKAAWEDAVARENAALARVAEEKTRVDAAEAEYERLQGVIRQESSDVAQLATIQTRAASLVERLDSQALLISEKRRVAETQCAELTARLNANEERRRLLQRQRADAAQRYDEAREKHAAAEAEVRKATADYEEARKVRVAAENELAQNSRKRNETQRSIDTTRRELAQAQEKLAGALGRVQASEGLDLDFRERVAAAERAFAEAQETSQRLSAELEQATSAEAAARKEMQAARTLRDEASAQAEKKRSAVRTLDSTIKGLEEIERSVTSAASPVRTWLLDHLDETTGALAALSSSIIVEEGYEALVEDLLGSDSLLLLAENSERALGVNARMANTEQGGSVTLMLSHDARHASSPALSAKTGSALVSHIDAKGDAAAAVSALLGDVVVCQTLAEALDARQGDALGLRFATPDGSVVYPNGKVFLAARTSSDVHEGSFARTRRISELKREIEAANRELEAADTAVKSAVDAAKIAQDAVLASSQRLADLKGSASSATRECAAAEQRLAKAKADLAASERSQAEAKALVESLRPSVEAKTLTLEQLELDLSDARDAVRATQQKLDPARATETRLSQELSDAKVRAVTLAQQETYELHIADERAAELKRLGDADETSLRALSDKQRARKRTEPLLETLQALNECAHRTLQEISAKVEAAQMASTGAHAQANAAREAYREKQSVLAGKNEALAAIREEKVRLEMRVQASADGIVSEMETSIEEALETPVLEDRSALEEEASRLTRRIANMGTINPDAAREYSELKARYDYLKAQLSDLASARATLKKIDAVIDERMRDDFARTFETVNDHFQSIFTQLFPGGQAYLSLVDPDDLENTGVEVTAQPRGKKISKMSLMSGGEKSLVALALLFAVYKTRSTPFYILDEVEAALDDSNLRRLIAYLGALREETQLIMITHQRRTMEMADVLFGVSMQADGVTQVISQRLDKALQYAE